MPGLSTITPGWFSYLYPSVSALSIAWKNRRRSKLAHTVVAAAELLEGRVLLSGVVVNSTSDTATGSGIVTLRDAIATADSSTSPTTITFDPTVFATAQTIVLDGTQLELSNTAEPTTITGPSAGVTISGNNASRIFYVDQGVTAAMSGLTFANGAAVTAGFPADRGGAVENYTGNLTITNSLFVNNTALNYGGAINEDGGSLTLINDTLTGNTVTDLVAANPTGPGSGGAISVSGAVVLNGVTISGNTAPNGGGICENSASGESFSLANTIVAGNVETVAGGGDAAGVQDETGVFLSLGNNLIGNTAGSSGWIGSDRTGSSSSPLAADLGSLANNGGQTETLLPLTGSPAIGAGSVALISSGVTTDQRGMPRTINGAVDIGAVEVGGATTPSSSVVVNSTSDTATGSGIVTLRDAIATADSSSSPTTITFDSTVFATAQTITLTGGQLELSNTQEATTITAPASGLTLDGNNASRIFFVDQGVTAAMSGLTFANGAAVTAGFPADRGGEIENSGGALQISDSLFVNNTALSYGGAINEDGGSLTLINDTLTGNTVTGPAANPTGPGGGGAISVAGTVTLEGDTIADNTAPLGGGIVQYSDTGATFSLANTIVADNTETQTGAGDAYGAFEGFVSLGHNLIGNTAGSSGWTSGDLTGSSASPLAADLGSLANNRGQTETLLPLTGSPALGAGSVALIPSSVTTDQRGMPRTINGAVDIGAVEVGGLVNDSPLVPAISGRLPSKPLVAGGRIAPFSQVIRVTNTSSSAISGEIMVSLLLSNDPSGASGGTSTASVMHKLTNLKPGKFVNVPVLVHSLPASPVGSLYILPEVTDPGGNTAFSTSTGTISVAAPFIDLQPLIVRAPASVKAGKARPVTVTLINNGNFAASGPLAIDLQASTNGAIDSTSIDMGTITRPHVVINPGRKLVVVLVEAFPTIGGPYNIVANVDPNDTFAESTLANNVLSSVATVKLI